MQAHELSAILTGFHKVHHVSLKSKYECFSENVVKSKMDKNNCYFRFNFNLFCLLIKIKNIFSCMLATELKKTTQRSVLTINVATLTFSLKRPEG